MAHTAGFGGRGLYAVRFQTYIAIYGGMLLCADPLPVEEFVPAGVKLWLCDETVPLGVALNVNFFIYTFYHKI